jgi:ankyrin repeat protein
MLEHGALPDIVNALGDTALRIAVINGKTELVGELLKFGANPKTKDRDGRLLLDVAKEYGHQSIVELMEKSPKN